MRLTVTLQVASNILSLEQLADAVGYTPRSLTPKGIDRLPPRTLPRANLWNGGLVLTDVCDIDKAVSECLDKYPEIGDRVRLIGQTDGSIKCTLYLGLAPLTSDWILYFRPRTLERLAELGCDLSIEYFEE